MKKLLALATALAAVCLMAGCDTTPDYSSPEAFLRDFVKALVQGQTERFASFYLHEGDFDPKAPSADLAKERFMGTVREEFLQRCNGAASFMSGKRVNFDSVEFRKLEPRVVQFLGNVKESYAGSLVHLTIGAQKARIEIDELIKVGEAWRLTQILLIVEEETEWGGEIELDASKSTVKHEEVIKEDDKDDDDKDDNKK